jgi:hypothetical protein
MVSMDKKLTRIKKYLKLQLLFFAFIWLLIIFAVAVSSKKGIVNISIYPAYLFAAEIEKKLAGKNKTLFYERFPTDRDKINHKYKLQELLRKKVEKTLLKLIKEPKLKKEGLVGSGSFQIRVVTLTPEGTVSPARKHKEKDREVKFDSPVSILNPYYKKVSDDAYFQAVIRMHKEMMDYRQKRGLVPNLPRDLTMDILFLNKLRTKKRLCDEEGNCLFIFSLEKHGLMENLESF